jgi:glucose-1-phosphate thymidylyltransferase
MINMKIIIPMAGIGKRMGGLTRHRPKALVRLTEKRLLDHVLSTFEQLEKTYTLEYIFIIGYLGEQIREYMRDVHPDKEVTYFVQEQQMGQSHAVHLAREAISGPILLTYCDTINRLDLSFLSLESMDGVASVHSVDDPTRHGVAVMGPDRLLTKLIEKPKTTEYRSALTGLYYFSEGRELIKAIETQMRNGTSLNNEYYLADAINILLDEGMRMRAENVLQWLDAGTPDAILSANASLLQQHHESPNEIVAEQSRVVIHPVYIDPTSRVENSVIGPNVSIGKNCSIAGSIIKNTIIDDDSNVTGVMLANSLVGKGCSVSGNPTQSIVADYDGIRVFTTTSETGEVDQVYDS